MKRNAGGGPLRSVKPLRRPSPWGAAKEQEKRQTMARQIEIIEVRGDMIPAAAVAVLGDGLDRGEV